MNISQIWTGLVKGTSTSATTNTTGTSSLFENTTTQNEAASQSSDRTVDTRISRLLDKYKVSADSDMLKGIDDFMETASGTDSEKLTTLEVALSKGIEPTASNLSDIHAALNEASLDSEQIDTLTASDTPSTEDTKKIVASMKLPEKLKALLAKMIDQGYTLKDALSAVTSALGGGSGDSVKSLLAKLNTLLSTMSEASVDSAISSLTGDTTAQTTSGTTSDLVSTLIEAFSAKTKITQSTSLLEQLQNTSSTSSEMASVIHTTLGESTSEEFSPKESATVVTASQGDAINLNQTYSPKSSHVISDAMSDVASDDNEDDVKSVDTESISDTEDNEDAFEQMVLEAVNALAGSLTSLSEQFEIKQYLVTETTELSIKLKTEFTTFQNDVSALLEAPEAQSETKLADNVQSAIEAIDKMITQKTTSLYTTMQTERDLLQLSSELRNASDLLQEGKVTEAIDIVEKAHNTVKSLYFEPDKRQVMLFMTQKTDVVQQTFENNENKKIQDILSQFQDDQGKHHARDVVETLRFMGQNHESEVVSSLESKETSKDDTLVKGNVKEILLKLAKEETENRTVTSTEKSLMNLNGQQMMNDQQQQGKRPFYFFNYPISEADDMSEMKVYVTGNQRQSEVDWKNSELYFGMALNTLGEAGIKVKITNGEVNISVLNDDYEALTTSIEALREDIEAAGFSGLTVTGEPYRKTSPLSQAVTSESASEVNVSENYKEGKVDIKV